MRPNDCDDSHEDLLGSKFEAALQNSNCDFVTQEPSQQGQSERVEVMSDQFSTASATAEATTTATTITTSHDTTSIEVEVG